MLLFRQFLERAGLSAEVGLREVVAVVQAIPYGRPGERTPAGVLAEWTGTCSTKHALLSELIGERWPELSPRLVHRVYRVQRDMARELFGEPAAAAVPACGLVDVHRYLIVRIGGRDVVIDATFPAGPRWDGDSDLPLACGPGSDYPSGADPDAGKAALEAANCDPTRMWCGSSTEVGGAFAGGQVAVGWCCRGGFEVGRRRTGFRVVLRAGQTRQG